MKDFSDFVRACYLNSEPSVGIKVHGKNFVGTYEECVAVADEVYRKTRVVLGIVKKIKQ